MPSQERLRPINRVLEFILFKVLRLKRHENDLGVHFYLPWRSSLLFRLDIGFARVSLYFPGFVSLSVGRLASDNAEPPASIYQVYFGIKQDGHQTHVLGEPDYLLSVAARRIDVPARVAYNSMAAF
jgi:hypothetical protein